MKSFALLSIFACVLAQSNTCPSGVTQGRTSNGFTFCCPSGTVSSDSTGTYCVLGCTMGYEPCYPFCSEPGTSNSETTSGVCTSVPVTASDYSQQVGLATGSGNVATDSASEQSGTALASGAAQSDSTSAMAAPSAAPSTAPSAAATPAANSPLATSSSVTSSSVISSSATATTSTTLSSSHNVGAIMTAAPLLIAGAIAGVVLV